MKKKKISYANHEAKLAFPYKNFQDWDFELKKGHDNEAIYVFSMKITV